MKSKNAVIGLVAAIAVNSVSASVGPTVVHEKQAHADIISKMLENVTTIAKMPECTVKTV